MTSQTTPAPAPVSPETNDSAADTPAAKTFADFGLDTALVDGLAEQGIIEPFPIQSTTLPMALKRADLIGQARTGTGKTFGFGLPLLHHIDVDRAATQALVVAPTRELAIQVAEDLRVGERRGVTITTIYGGVGYEPQIEALQAGVHVVVGTPGRLLDLLGRGDLRLHDVETLVLDEADEMLDLGFLPDVERLISACPDDRQTMLFSATMPPVIVSMARKYMDKPTFMRAEMDLPDVAPTVDQYFFEVHPMDKPRVLARVLQQPDRGGVYVFCRTKRMCDRLVEDLDALGVQAITIHGDLSQAKREVNLDKFRDAKVNVLVATEVAARGLDVEDVTHVVNYDIPDDEKMYLHRIGRTARAGNKGAAITFAAHDEVTRLQVIRKAVEASDHEVHTVFSTSPVLQELFDLPDETPWEHLSTTKKRSKRSSGDKERSGGGRNERSASRGRRNSSRSVPSARSAKGEPDRTADDRRNTPRDDDRSRDDRGGARGAQRSRDEPGRDESSERRSTKKRDATGPRTVTTDSGARVRIRVRDGATSGAKGSRDGGSSDGDGGRSGSDRQRSDRQRSDRQRSDRQRSDRQRGDRQDGDRQDGDRDDSGRGRSGGRRDDRGGSRRRGRGRDDDGSSGRGARGRGKGASSRDDRSGRQAASAEAPTRRERTTRRGDEARGDGRPGFNRRVEVEHIP